MLAPRGPRLLYGGDRPEDRLAGARAARSWGAGEFHSGTGLDRWRPSLTRWNRDFRIRIVRAYPIGALLQPPWFGKEPSSRRLKTLKPVISGS